MADETWISDWVIPEHRLAYYEDVAQFSSAMVQVDPRDLAALIRAYREARQLLVQTTRNDRQ